MESNQIYLRYSVFFSKLLKLFLMTLYYFYLKLIIFFLDVSAETISLIIFSPFISQSVFGLPPRTGVNLLWWT